MHKNHHHYHTAPLTLSGFLEEVFNPKLNQQERNLAVDIVEGADNFVVYTDLPGLSKEDISIEFYKGDLRLLAKARPATPKNEGEKYVMFERKTLPSSKILHFGDNIDSDNIKATFKDGVLSLVVPKKEATINVKKIVIE